MVRIENYNTIPQVGQLWKYDDKVYQGYCVIKRIIEIYPHQPEAEIIWICATIKETDYLFKNTIYTFRYLNDERFWNKLA